MKRLVFMLLGILNVLVLATTGSLAQDRDITLSEFWDYMRESQSQTKDVSFREMVTIEVSDTLDETWEPYSSWINEQVFPDRSRLIYTSRIKKSLIRIGNDVYAKEPDGPWTHEKLEKKRSFNNPAALYGHAKSRLTITTPLPHNNKGTMLIRAVSKSWHITDPDKEMKVDDYWYDEKGVLIRTESIGHTGERWRREIVIIEYDPKIRIEAPIK